MRIIPLLDNLKSKEEDERKILHLSSQIICEKEKWGGSFKRIIEMNIKNTDKLRREKKIRRKWQHTVN